MQYPMPPWRTRLGDPATAKQRKIRPDKARYAHLPIVAGQPDGTITVIRGTAADADVAAADPDARRLFSPDGLGREHLLISNRLGQTMLMPLWGTCQVGVVELWLYTAEFALDDALTTATSIDDLRDAPPRTDRHARPPPSRRLAAHRHRRPQRLRGAHAHRHQTPRRGLRPRRAPLTHHRQHPTTSLRPRPGRRDVHVSPRGSHCARPAAGLSDAAGRAGDEVVGKYDLPVLPEAQDVGTGGPDDAREDTGANAGASTIQRGGGLFSNVCSTYRARRDRRPRH